MKKYNLSEIMKRAHEIRKQDARNIFSLCLKMAWKEAKEVKVEEEKIDNSKIFKAVLALEEKMAAQYPDCNVVSKRNDWERGSHYRVYYSITRYERRGRKSKEVEKIHLGYYDVYGNEYVQEKKYDKNVFELLNK